MRQPPEFYRLTSGYASTRHGSGINGAYSIPAPIIRGRNLIVLASDGHDWDLTKLPPPVWEHVSVHAESGTTMAPPTWNEMHFIKQLFWDDEECVIQFHPPASTYVNCHPHTLHLWRPIGVELPLPPLITI